MTALPSRCTPPGPAVSVTEHHHPAKTASSLLEITVVAIKLFFPISLLFMHLVADRHHNEGSCIVNAKEGSYDCVTNDELDA
ncbi:hypothetical protein RJT34_09774 [Clitoria ternatea]|uniref:Uncharacterized protein n=1 Tax=Clitoria ternatea TaxID=43366 RepID=A0AAN9PVK3_CLITE